MQRQMITAVLGLASGLAMAQAPLTENQMMEYTSKVSKATIGKKYDLHLPLVSQQSPSTANASAAIVQAISHPGASYIKLHFKNLNLEQGGKLIVRSEDNAEYYAYSQDNLRAATIDPTISDDGITQFSAMSVSADKVIVEYIPGAGKTDKTPEIDFYYHGVEGQNYLESATDVTTLSTVVPWSVKMYSAGRSHTQWSLSARVLWLGY